MTNCLLKNTLVFQMRQIVGKARLSLSDDLAEIALTVTEASVLMVIDENKDITSSEIGRFLHIKRANMTPLVSQLCERGFVNTSAKDGRSIALSLTEEGKRQCELAIDTLVKHDQGFFAALSADERESMLATLKHLNANT